MRRGFSLIEMLAYVGLLSTLLVMVGSLEHSVRLGVSAHTTRLRTQQEALALTGLKGKLTADIRAARAIGSVGERLLELTGDDDTVRWELQGDVLSRDGEPIARDLERFSFAAEDGGVRFSGVVLAEDGLMRHRHHVSGWAFPRSTP